jgi:hypothetical protein
MKFQSSAFLYADCFDNPTIEITGRLKDNFDELILSDLWPAEVLESMIVTGDDQATTRARSIISAYGISSKENAKFLDFGCGEGHCVIEAAKANVESYGYDIEEKWKPEKTAKATLTTSRDIILENAPYSIILLYDVIDHIMTHEEAVEVSKFIKSISDSNTVIRARCHPWTSRHGGHLYTSINKAYAHILLSEDELKKHLKEPVRRITRPLYEYGRIFEEAGLSAVDIKKSHSEMEDIFRSKELQTVFAMKLDANSEWQESVLPLTFIDYTLKVK